MPTYFKTQTLNYARHVTVRFKTVRNGNLAAYGLPLFTAQNHAKNPAIIISDLTCLVASVTVRIHIRKRTLNLTSVLSFYQEEPFVPMG